MNMSEREKPKQCKMILQGNTTSLLLSLTMLAAVAVVLIPVILVDYTAYAQPAAPRSAAITPSAVNFTKIFAEKLTKTSFLRTDTSDIIMGII